jgi:thiol:disulfide interchange protein
MSIAQDAANSRLPTLGKKSPLGSLGGLGGFGGLSSRPYSFEATYSAEQGGIRGQVELTVTLSDDHSIYSVTQPKGGPLRTVIEIESPGIKLDGPFIPNQPPRIYTNEVGFEGVSVEKHFDFVTWTAPLVFDMPLGETPEPLNLTVDGQVCKSACIPVDRETIQAEFVGFYESMKPTNQPYRDSEARTEWSIGLDRATATPGETVTLELRSKTEAPFHIYAVRPNDENTESSTIVILTKKGSLLAGVPVPDSKPIDKEMIPGVLTIHYHDAEAVWRIPIQVPSDAQEGSYPIEGLIGYQACNEENCEEPLGLKFSGALRVAKTPLPSPVLTGEGAEVRALDIGSGKSASSTTSPPFSIEKASYSQVVAHPSRLNWFEKASFPSKSDKAEKFVAAAPIAFADLLKKFGLAVLGGFVLNFMPCVLPVIGLKIMSFVNEANRSGKSILVLNLWYMAGIMAVFLGLAAFTVFFRSTQGDAFGWGEQFGSLPLRVGLTILMFVMALSFLGVWEIPVPGFASGKTSQGLMQKEGPLGAFSKGLLTTVLATPCSGPGLAAAFAVAISQPAWVIYLMYFGVGLGMSLPFILVCLSPGIVRLIPKPGPWMQTFKEFLAFPMLFAVVWLFLTTFSGETLIAVIITLIGAWFACWWIGQVPAWSAPAKKWTNWSAAVAVAVLIGFGAFRLYGEHDKRIAWVPYSASELAAAESEKKTVMIDFTAQWCANCKFNLLTAIETDDVANVINREGVVAMLADFTDRSPEIKAKLHELESNSIPVLAIYPGGNFDEPIILRDVVTKKRVVEALEQAVKASKLASNAPEDHGLPVSVSRQAPP